MLYFPELGESPNLGETWKTGMMFYVLSGFLEQIQDDEPLHVQGAGGAS